MMSRKQQTSYFAIFAAVSVLIIGVISFVLITQSQNHETQVHHAKQELAHAVNPTVQEVLVASESINDHVSSTMTVYPSGILKDYSVSLVAQTCSLCYNPATFGTPMRTLTTLETYDAPTLYPNTDFLQKCNIPGKSVFLGAFSSSSPDNFLLGAFGPSEAVFSPTTGNAVTNANGVDWYFDELDSMGFAPQGAGINKVMYADRCGFLNKDKSNQVVCPDDGDNKYSELRMSWSLNTRGDYGGFRLGTATDLMTEDSLYKAIYLCP